MNPVYVIYAIIASSFGGFTPVVESFSADDTQRPRAGGKDTVKAVQVKLEESFIFSETEDNGFLMRAAVIESDYGTDLSTYREHYFGGIWQVNEENYNKTKDKAFLGTFKKLKVRFNIDWLLTTWEDLEKPLFSGIAFSILLQGYGVKIPNTIRGQAEYWKTYYNPNSTVSIEAFVETVAQLETKFVCKIFASIVLILDGSGSVGYTEYQKAKVAISNLTTGIYGDNTRLGFISYSSTPVTIINLQNKFNSDQIRQLILNVPYPEQSTMTNLAVDVAVSQLSGVDDESPRIILTFTDGQSDLPQLTRESANRATQAGIIMFSVGIGRGIVNDGELNILAGEKPGHKLAIDNFDALPELIYGIASEVCFSEVKPRNTEPFHDTLSVEETRYFKYEMPEVGLTINRKDISGRTVGFYSYFFPNPYDGLNDGRLNEKGKTFIPKNNSSDVHISIQGVRKENNYTIISSKGNTRRTPAAIARRTDNIFQPCAGYTEINCQDACERESWIFGTCSLYLCICDE